MKNVFVDDPLTHRIIGCAIEVHRNLGPGLLEATYEECLAVELASAGLKFERQVGVPLLYKSAAILKAYRLDFLVEQSVIIELKALETLLRLHEAQVLTYLKLSDLRLGLLINFNAVPLHSGIRRLTNASSQVSPVSLFLKRGVQE